MAEPQDPGPVVDYNPICRHCIHSGAGNGEAKWDCGAYPDGVPLRILQGDPHVGVASDQAGTQTFTPIPYMIPTLRGMVAEGELPRKVLSALG